MAKYYRSDPWDYGAYETGRTRPPKKKGCLTPFLLMAVIALSGLVSALSFLNVRLFSQLKTANAQHDNTMSIIREMEENEASMASAYDPEETEAMAEAYAGQTMLDLVPSETAVDTFTQEQGLSLQEIYARNIDSVVSITCSKRTGSSTGTGVIFSDQGYIVTNYHVIEDARAVTVLLTDEREFEATLVGADAASDLAVLYVESNDLTAAEFGDSTTMRVGDSVAAIGDPLGSEFRGTLTNGIVSAINRDVSVGGRTMTLIQTNAAINSGNSGGPLINCYGQVIGINTLKIGDNASYAGVEGLGFAIPSTTVKEVVDQLINQGYVSGRPTLGIWGEGVSSFYQHYYRMPAGLYIGEIDPDSDAAAKGLVIGDILLMVDHTRITSMEDLESALYNLTPGDTVNIIIYRYGTQYQVDLVLSEAKG